MKQEARGGSGPCCESGMSNGCCRASRWRRACSGSLCAEITPALQLANAKTRTPSVEQWVTFNLAALENQITTNLWSFSLMQPAIKLNRLAKLYHVFYVAAPFSEPCCFVFVSWQEMENLCRLLICFRSCLATNTTNCSRVFIRTNPCCDSTAVASLQLLCSCHCCHLFLSEKWPFWGYYTSNCFIRAKGCVYTPVKDT